MLLMWEVLHGKGQDEPCPKEGLMPAVRGGGFEVTEVPKPFRWSLGHLCSMKAIALPAWMSLPSVTLLSEAGSGGFTQGGVYPLGLWSGRRSRSWRFGLWSCSAFLGGGLNT